MDVDKAGRDDLAPGVDFFGASAGQSPDLRDPTILHADVCLNRRRACAVDDLTASDDEIERPFHH
jgi:hypothetical protein